MSIFGDNPLAGLNDPGSAPAPTDTPSAPVDSGAGVPPADPGPITPPSDPGAVTPPVDDAAPQGTPGPAYFNPDDYKDHLVKLKVGGQDVELSLSEALQGAMRGADYTRKTQELSQERKKLYQAEALTASLENDPIRTIQQLAEAYDLDVGQLQRIQRDPDEQRLVDRDRMLRQQQAQLDQQRVQFEINRLMNEFNVAETDIPGIAQVAISMGTDLETAYKAVQFDQMRQAQAEESRRQSAATAARNAQVVHSGSTTQRGAVTPGPEKVNSIHDAWKLAEKQLNLSP